MSWRSRLTRALRRQARRVQENRPNCNKMVLRDLRMRNGPYPRGVYPWKQSWLCARMMFIRGYEQDQIHRHSKESRRKRRA